MPVRSIIVVFLAGSAGVAMLFALAVTPVQASGWNPDPDFAYVSIPGAEIVCFDIRGRIAKDLYNQIDEKKPFKEAGQANTSWSVEYTYTQDDPESPDCRILDYSINTKLEVMVPRWTNPEAGSLVLVLQWKQYMAGVTRHESNHINIYLDREDLIRQALEQHPSCAETLAAVKSVLQETGRLGDEYDQFDNHITTEHILFPFFLKSRNQPQGGSYTRWYTVR